MMVWKVNISNHITLHFFMHLHIKKNTTSPSYNPIRWHTLALVLNSEALHKDKGKLCLIMQLHTSCELIELTIFPYSNLQI